MKRLILTIFVFVSACFYTKQPPKKSEPVIKKYIVEINGDILPCIDIDGKISCDWTAYHMDKNDVQTCIITIEQYYNRYGDPKKPFPNAFSASVEASNR